MSMKTFLFIFLTLAHTGVRAQNSIRDTSEADAILHVWETREKDGTMQILKSGDRYYGKMLYGKDLMEADGKTYKKDVNNPDSSLRSRPLKDYTLISGLIYKDGKWVNGKIYYFVNGNSYDVDLEIKDATLYMRAFMGIRMFGKTVKWDLVK